MGTVKLELKTQGELLDEITRLRAALKDIQAKAMSLKPPRHTWYYDRAEVALTNGDGT